MRDHSSWKKKLQEQLASAIGEKTSSILSMFCDVELALTLLYEIFPRESPMHFWSLLTGYIFSYPKYSHLTLEEKRRIARARFYLIQYKSRIKWEDALLNYSKINESFRLFHFTGDVSNGETRLQRVEIAVIPEREEIYRKTLDLPPSHQEVDFQYAKSGKIFFYFNQKIVDSEIPKDWEREENNNGFLTFFANKRRRKTLIIKWCELIEVAKMMDNQLSQNYYGKTLETMDFVFSKDGKIKGVRNNKEIHIQDCFHLVGMLGTGKSTFLDVLTVWAAKNNLHTTILLDSVVSVLDKVSFLESLNIKTVPILGQSNRSHHLAKFHLANPLDLSNDSLVEGRWMGLKWLSNTCPLCGYVSNGPISFEPGKNPCFELYEENPQGAAIDSKNPEKKVCPLIGRCQSHRASHHLEAASVWVGTPASMIYTSVPFPTFKKRVLYYELIYRRSDLLIIDEIDRVQVLVDSFFAPSQQLIEKGSPSWLDDLGQIHSKGHFSEKRYQIIDSNIIRNWHQACNRVQEGVDYFFLLLKDNDRLYNSIEKEILIANSLMDSFIATLERDGRLTENEMKKMIYSLKRFKKDPLHFFKKNTFNLMSFFQWVINNRGNNSKEDLLKQFEDYFGFSIDLFQYDRFLLLLTIVWMESSLKVVLRYWDEVSHVFDLNLAKLNFLQVKLDDYWPIIPESPTGSLFGFKYSNFKNPNLQLFFYRGVGRYILLNFPSLFSLSDDYDGPHAVYLSGTSWAPGSMNYHFQKKPDAVIKTSPSFLEGANEMKFIFRPTYKEDQVIQVSGTRDEKRTQNLKDILNSLTRQNQSSMTPDSVIEQELKSIEDPKRKRLLLLVGSYNECNIATEYLQNAMRDREGWTPKSIVQLVSDEKDSENNHSILHRGRVSQFPEGEGKILVAPLLAIERGHNILNDEGCAAIATLFFLVRPMPVPSDLLPVILSLNQRAISFLSQVDNTYQNSKTIGDWGKEIRQQAMIHWKQLLEINRKGPMALIEEELDGLYWNQFVIIWQVIGRIIRGGVTAKVFFVDGAFAKKASQLEVDTERTSMIVGIEKILRPFFDENKTSLSFEKKVAQNLYRPFYYALKQTEGVYKDENA